VARGVRRTRRLSGTLEQSPDVVVQLIGNTRSGHLSERPAALTLESVGATIKTKIKSIPPLFTPGSATAAVAARQRC
jgi:hypothetical protein